MNPEYDEECSCTNCDFAIGPEILSGPPMRSRRLKINKFSNSQYLTPRDKKLLKKLAKTRAMYDDVRSEILSENECDDSCVGDPGYLDKMQIEDRGDNKNKHAVRAIVDVIDRGELPSSDKPYQNYQKPLDDCQTCCAYFEEQTNKKSHKHKQAKTNKAVDTFSSSRLYAIRKPGYRDRKMRSVRFNTKYIRSDPCTCTMNLLGNVYQDKIKPKYITSKTPTEIESKAIKAKRCVCECNITKASSSKNSLQMVKNKVRQSIISSISNLENKFRNKKDSIKIYRDRLRNKRAMKQYECEPGYCIPEECLPLSCNEKIKAKPSYFKSSIPKISDDVSELSRKATKRKQKSKSKNICICEPGPEFEPAYRHYDRIKSELSSIKNSIHDTARKSIHDIAKVASDASMEVVNKIQSKRKEKKSNNLCVCEPEAVPELKPVEHKYYDKVKIGLDSIKKSFHEIRKVVSNASVKGVKKIRSKRKEKKSNKICICEPEPEPKSHLWNIFSKTGDQTQKSKPKLGLNSIKKSFHEIGKTVSDTSVRFVKKIRSKRKDKKTNNICTCEPEPESGSEPEPLKPFPEHYDKVKLGLDSVKNSFHELRIMASDASVKVVKKIRSKRKEKKSNNICICEPKLDSGPEPKPLKPFDTKHYDNVKHGLDSLNNSFNELRIMASDASLKVVKKIRSKRKDKKSNNICICEPKLDSGTEPEPLKPFPEHYDKVKLGLDSVKNSFHELRTMASDASVKVVRKIRSKRKEKKSKNICICEPRPISRTVEHKYYDTVKLGLDSVKRSLHEIGKVASGISFKVASKIKSKRKQKSKPIICICEPPPESNLSILRYDKPVLPKRRNTKQSYKRNGLSFHIQPSALAKKSIKKARKVVCECDKIDKAQKKVSRKIDTKPLFGSNVYSTSTQSEKSSHPKVREASVCMPDECDYQKCAEILMSQYKPEYDSVYSRNKLVGSFSKKKSKHSQYTYEEPTKSESITNITPTKQVVRIGSNFSFNIEFYKETKQGSGDNDSRIPLIMHEKRIIQQKARHSNPRRVLSQNKSIQLEQKKVCDSSTCHHDLKRCFCTLALEDDPNKDNNSLFTEEKSSYANFKLCECDKQRVQKIQTKNIKKPISVKSSSFARDSFFNSIEICDPFICESKTRKKLRTHSIGTKSPISISKYSVKSQCNDFGTSKHSKSIHDANESIELPKIERAIENSSSRNVVRIGSSFSFNIQFYKDRKPHHDDIPMTIKKKSVEPKNKIKKYFKKEKRKRSIRHEAPKSSFNLADSDFKKTGSSLFDRTISTFSTSKSRMHSIKIDKATKMKSLKKVPKSISDYDITRTTQTSGPVVYVTPPIPPFPSYCKDVCDPFCTLKSKRRNLKHQFNDKRMNTERHLKSVSNNTRRSQSDASSSKRQMLKHRCKEKSRNYDTTINEQDKSLHRQAVRIGSSFSFNIEFYKDLNSTGKSVESNIVPVTERNKNIYDTTKYYPKKRTFKCIDMPQPQRQKSTQVTKVHETPKESFIKPFIDKCLCTLKLLKVRKELVQPKEIAKVQSRTCQCELRKSAYHSLYKPKHTTTDTIAFKSLSSGTSKSYMKCQKLQVHAPLSNGRQSVKLDTESYTNEYEDQLSRPNKQVVRIGSSFSFNVEFYKERGDYNQNSPKNNQRKKISTTETYVKSKKNHIGKRACNKKTSVQIQSKGNEIVEWPTSVIKRCLCSLKLIKNRRESYKPLTKNKSVVAKESKKAFKKRILPLCNYEKSIDTKSLKQLRQVSSSQAIEPARSDMMKSVTCYTDEPMKSRAQKTQSDLCKPCHKANYIKEKNTDNLSTTTSQKKSVIISSSFNFQIEFSKKRKPPNVTQRKDNISKLSQLQRAGLHKRIMKERRCAPFRKRGRKSIFDNFGLMAKSCMCEQKDQIKYKIERKNANQRKEIQAEIPTSNLCEPHLCEKSVMARRKQRKVKSVLDVKNPPIKMKKVKSNFREAATKMHSDQSIKRALPKQKHRVQKSPSKNVARLDSRFKFDVEFFKQFGSLEDDGSINYRKLVRPKDRNSVKKSNDKRLCRPHCIRHREYQVGFVKNEMAAIVRSPFHQQMDVCYVEIPNNKMQERSAVVNPIKVMEGNPYRNINHRSNLKNKHKKRVRFQTNMDKKIQTNVKIRNQCTSPCDNVRFIRHDKNVNRFLRKGSLMKRRQNKNYNNEKSNRPEGVNERKCHEECFCCGAGQLTKRKKYRKTRRLPGYIDEHKKKRQVQNKRQYIFNGSRDENMTSDITIIKPYSKRKFKKTRSKNCLSPDCIFGQQNDQLRQGTVSVSSLTANKNYRGWLFARKKLAKIRKSLHRSTNTCNEICLAKGKTNLAKGTTDAEVSNPVSFSKKQKKLIRSTPHTPSISSTDASINRQGIKLKKHKKYLKGEKANKSSEELIPVNVSKKKRKLIRSKPKTSDAATVSTSDASIYQKGIKRRKHKKYLKSEKTNKVKNQQVLKTLHEDSKKAPCKCGSSICKKMSKSESHNRSELQTKEIIKIQPPCTCGSEVCKKKSKLNAEKNERRSKHNICVCPSLGHICECSKLITDRKMKKKKEKEKKKIEEKKIKKKKAKRKECCRMIRQSIRNMKKEKEEKQLAKQYKESSDTMLAAESVLDFFKMTTLLSWNVLKCTFKLITKPKTSYRDFKRSLRNPSVVGKKCLNSKFVAIAGGLKRKIGAMKITKNTQSLLEKNDYSRYLIHSCDKSASKRLAKVKKMRRRRSRMDFECSPYMASLRKRPHLWFYDRCPSFYPQFISMLAMWRQFMDMVFFLIAVVVWSPCILGIEVCRALMCCCLCTG